LTRSFLVLPLVYIETLSSTAKLCVVPDTHRRRINTANMGAFVITCLWISTLSYWIYKKPN
jgi:hypothetical protein